MIKFPIIDKELITILKEVFPDKLPNLSQGQRIDEFGLGFLYGNKEVIDKLEAEYNEQQELLSETTHTT